MCDYHQCEEPAHGTKPTDKSWHLCESHQTQLEEIGARVPFDPIALLGFWARGTDREKFVKEMTEKAAPFIRELRKRLQKALE